MTIDTPEGIALYRAKVIFRAIELWCQHGIKANRAYTPGGMARAATSITGREYRSSKKALRQAASDLHAYIVEAEWCLLQDTPRRIEEHLAASPLDANLQKEWNQ